MQFVIERKTKINLLIMLLFSLLINLSKEDLPVHCLKHQVSFINLILITIKKLDIRQMDH